MEGSSIGGFVAIDNVVLGDEIQDYLTAVSSGDSLTES